MDETGHHHNSEKQPRALLTLQIFFAAINVGAFSSYTISLPFVFSEMRPHIFITCFVILGLTAAVTKYFRPFLPLAIAGVFLTPIFSAIVYVMPNLTTIISAMVMSFLAATSWVFFLLSRWFEATKR